MSMEKKERNELTVGCGVLVIPVEYGPVLVLVRVGILLVLVVGLELGPPSSTQAETGGTA